MKIKSLVNKICSLCLGLVILVPSLSHYAAVVSDNDAAGYVTKAEFEAMKKNIQFQIDLYNDNLGNAIDGAIETYLSQGDFTIADFDNIKVNLKNGSLLERTFKIYSDTKDGENQGVISCQEKKLTLDAGTGTLSWGGPSFDMKDYAQRTTLSLNFMKDIEFGKLECPGTYDYDILIGGTRFIYSFFNTLYPVGTRIVANQAPGFGEWVEVLPDKGRALWGTGGNFGETIAQGLPTPTDLYTANDGAHTHNFTGNTVTTNTTGAHYHNYTYKDPGTAANWYSGGSTYSMFGVEGTMDTPSEGSHYHTATPLGSINNTYSNHTHTLSYTSSEKIYKSGVTKVQPDAYVIKIWERVN